MKKRLLIYFLLQVLFFSNGFAQTTDTDPYNFNFTIKPDSKWIKAAPQAMIWDSTQIVSGKHPLVFVRSLKSLSRSDWNTSTLSQRIILPYSVDDSIHIRIRNSCGNLTKGMFYINRYDEKMNLVSLDSININVDGWNTHTLTLPPRSVRVLDIAFWVDAFFFGAMTEKYQQPDFSQFMALDNMEIKVGDKDIASLGVASLKDISNPVILDRKKLSPLNFSSRKELLPLENKKILALGESMHCNDEISRVVFEVIKNRIRKNNCRLVMLEIPYNQGLVYNYYVSGATVPPVFMEVMKKMGQLTIPTSYYAFMDWLREYNKDKQRKVLLLGIDGLFNDCICPELEVLNAAVKSKNDRDSLTYIFEDITRSYYKKVVNEVTAKQDHFINLMGKETYELFRYTLELNARFAERDSSDETYNEEISRFLKRDQTQYEIAQKYLTSFLENNETACIYAHYDHLAKSPMSNFLLPLGYFLHKQYGDAYQSVVVLVGQGTSTMNEGNGFFRNFQLAPPVANSIEYAANKLSDTCYYYPFDSNNYKFSFIRLIGNLMNIDMLDSVKQFPYLLSPKGHLDGFIYIPKGRPMFKTTDPDELRKNYRKHLAAGDVIYTNSIKKQYNDAKMFLSDRRIEFTKNGKYKFKEQAEQ